MLVSLTALSISTRLKKSTKEEWTETFQFKTVHKCTKANTRAIQQQAAHTNYHYLLDAQEEPYKKNDKTERARELGTKMRMEIVQRNQMAALRFQTEGWHKNLLQLVSRNINSNSRNIKEK